jgi:hypothetical protein
MSEKKSHEFQRRAIINERRVTEIECLVPDDRRCPRKKFYPERSSLKIRVACVTSIGRGLGRDGEVPEE